MKPSPCPCNSGKTWQSCCKPLIDGSRQASSAEQVMRSRYSAYTTSAIDYLLASTHPETRSLHKASEIKSWAESTDWRQLRIIHRMPDTTNNSTADNTNAEVEFVAFYQQDGQLKQHHELSQFKKNADRWYFYKGEQLADIKLERNMPCPCGSEKKFKKCCGQ